MVAQGVVVRGVRAPSAVGDRPAEGAEWWASGASSDHQLIDRNVDVVEALTTVDDAKGDVAFAIGVSTDDLGASRSTNGCQRRRASCRTALPTRPRRQAGPVPAPPRRADVALAGGRAWTSRDGLVDLIPGHVAGA